MTSNFTDGEFVRIRDVAGRPHLGTVTKTVKGKYVLVRLLTGIRTARSPEKVEKLSDSELMIIKLEE